MKILVIIAALALAGCGCGSELSTNQVAYRVGYCNDVSLDYVIEYNNKGKATDVVCFKPGTSPPKQKGFIEQVNEGLLQNSPTPYNLVP